MGDNVPSPLSGLLNVDKERQSAKVGQHRRLNDLDYGTCDFVRKNELEAIFAILQTLETGLPVLLGQLALTLVIWLVSLSICLWVTPCHEIREIRSGNVAAAVAGGGAALGAAIPLAFCFAGSVSSWDIVIWAVPIMILQVSAFWLTQLFVPDLSAKLEENDLAAAIFLLCFRLGFASINAAAISV